MNKAIVIATLNNMPEEFRTEELIERLLIIEELAQELENENKGKISAFNEAQLRFNICLN